MTRSADFLALARRESSRYGGDPWVFVRELLQNSRDAGARAVAISVGCRNGVEFILIEDDGRGMDWTHARNYLLTLHASSKAEEKATAGRFGVGFWSVLRFEPDEIILRSRPPGGDEAWEARFSSDLGHPQVGRGRSKVGSGVELRRKSRGGDVEKQVWEAVRRYARHLRVPGTRRRIVRVTVNGRLATEAMHPGRPGLEFGCRGLYGTVTLAAEPLVEIFAHGLLVRTAATVDDVLLGPAGKGRRRAVEAARGFAPHVKVDSDRLSVLAARGDLAQDRELTRLARRVRAEIHRLMIRELDRIAPRSIVGRIIDVVTTKPKSWIRGLVGAAIAGALLLAVGSMADRVVPEFLKTRSPSEGAARTGIVPFMDNARGYGGPITDPIRSVRQAPDLRYRPAEAEPWFAAFRISGMTPEGIPLRIEGSAPVIGGGGEEAESLEISLGFRSTGGEFRLPVPTGFMVDPASVRADGRPVEAFRTAVGEPAIHLRGEESGRLSYRVFEAPERVEYLPRWPVLPQDLARVSASLRVLEPAARVVRAIDVVRERLETRRGAEDAAALRRWRESGLPLVEAACMAGGGDCDVVNSILAAVLHDSGLHARLAVGWLGAAGRAVPGLHAWVEVDLGGGRWVVADASSPAPAGGSVRVAGEGRSSFEPGRGNAVEAGGSVRTGEGGVRGLLYGFLGILVVGGVAVLVVWWSRRSSVVYSPGLEEHASPLVASCLHDRDQWARFPAVWRRPIIPTIGGRLRSLADLDRASSLGRLFSSAAGEQSGNTGSGAHHHSPVLRAALRGGGIVLDASTGRGTAAAQALAAPDLDLWDRLLRGRRHAPLCAEVERLMNAEGRPIEIFESEEAPRPAAALQPDGRRTCVAVNPSDPRWTRAREVAAVEPDLAVLLAVELVVDALPGLAEVGRRAVVRPARRFLERSGGAES